MDHNSMIEVIAAHRDGKKIQCQYASGCPWHDVVAEQPSWDFSAKDWRVKPEPLELWVNIHECMPSQGYTTREGADKWGNGRIRCVHMREVVE